MALCEGSAPKEQTAMDLIARRLETILDVAQNILECSRIRVDNAFGAKPQTQSDVGKKQDVPGLISRIVVILDRIDTTQAMIQSELTELSKVV